MSLVSGHCVPCEGGMPALSKEEVDELRPEVREWTVETRHQGGGAGGMLRRSWRLEDFQQCLGFANAIGTVAEEEGHHPDIHITEYRNIEVVLWTHAVGGLTRNDFILAAKIDRLA